VTGRPRAREVEIDFNRILERGLLTPNSAQSRLANELRVIKRPLINNCVGKGATQVKHARRIMVTSALPGEGKSFISMNLALSIAMERDSTVLLLEGDPTRPALAEMLGIPPARGLMDLLVDPKLDVSDVLIRTNLGRLSFIPAGTRQENATELLASTVMEDLVEQLYERYPDRILIFDSPPLLAAPEPRVLAQHMGQIVYVVEADQTAQSTVQEALATIESCPVVMAVLNKSSFREEGYYYSYYYTQAE
jgi:receptor protein-tyrosine kinase